MEPIKIGGALLIAESAAARTWQEWAILLGAVCAATGAVVIVDWIDRRWCKMSEETSEFDEFLATPYERDADVWRWMPQLLDVLSESWGKPLEGRAAKAYGWLRMAAMTPDGIVAAVQLHRRSR